MSIEILLTHVIKDIGVLTERVNSLEACLLNETIKGSYEEPYDEVEEIVSQELPSAHRLSFPIVGKVNEDSIMSTEKCRYIKNSMYKVEILKSYSEEAGSPIIVTIDMTRDELDDFIAKNPGKNYKEFIVSIKPSLEEYL